jgi:heme-degrading monooxygenase HmoA
MPYAFTQDVPIPWAVYQKIRASLGEGAPEGLVVHVVIETETGLRYVDVWESEQAFRTFVETRLHRAVATVLKQAGVARPPEPQTLPISVREVWVGESRVR